MDNKADNNGNSGNLYGYVEKAEIAIKNIFESYDKWQKSEFAKGARQEYSKAMGIIYAIFFLLFYLLVARILPDNSRVSSFVLSTLFLGTLFLVVIWSQSIGKIITSGTFSVVSFLFGEKQGDKAEKNTEIIIAMVRDRISLAVLKKAAKFVKSIDRDILDVPIYTKKSHSEIVNQYISDLYIIPDDYRYPYACSFFKNHLEQNENQMIDDCIAALNKKMKESELNSNPEIIYQKNISKQIFDEKTN